MSELTGRTRHRSQRRWGREELVLQVEEGGSEMALIGPYPERMYFTRWRDALSTDFVASGELVARERDAA